jgi:RNA polymerase sigma-70 factor (sigma-E family)
VDDIASVFAAHHASALRLAYLLTGSQAHAEDVTAEVFAKMVRLRPRMDNPGGYIRRAVHNEVSSSWRRRAREHAYLEQHHTDDRGQGDWADDGADRDLLWSALGQLPPRQRTALVLRFYEDLSERETARVMGVSTGTVKSTTARGLAALRRQVPDLVAPAARS